MLKNISLIRYKWTQSSITEKVKFSEYKWLEINLIQ